MFLDGGEKYGEIFVRARDLPKETKAGDSIEAFIYSSNDGICATVKNPMRSLANSHF